MRIPLLAFMVLTIFSSCQQPASTDTAEPVSAPQTRMIKKGMIKVSIIYPNAEGNTFDMDYYANNHMPMVADLFGPSLRKYAIDKGLSGRTPDDPMPYLAVGYFYFDKLEDYANAFSANGEQILNDIPNYTNIQPIVQISEIVH